jgi:hypothetical protein
MLLHLQSIYQKGTLESILILNLILMLMMIMIDPTAPGAQAAVNTVTYCNLLLHQK